MPLPPLDQLSPSRILLIKPSALGDIVHSLPVLSALRRRFPSAHLSWLVNRAYEPLIAGHPDLDATLIFDRGALKGGRVAALRSLAALWRTLRQGRFDLVLDLQGLLRSGLMTRATGAGRRVGLAGSREGARWFYTDVLPDPGRAGLHAVDRYWLVAQALGAATSPPRFHLPVAPQAMAWADSTLAPLPRPWLVLAVGSRWETKCWPPVHFGTLAGRAQAEFGGSVVFVGGREETPLAAQVAARLPGPSLDLTGRTTLPQLAATLAKADAMVGNDTGPLHVAVALGRPVIAPYTCTKAALTGPYGQTHRAVETSVWCAGSYRRRCDRMECMAELTPERLWPTLRDVLDRWHEEKRSA